MSKPKSTGGFLKLFDVSIEVTVSTQVYADSGKDAKDMALQMLDDLIEDEMEIRIDKTIVVIKEEDA